MTLADGGCRIALRLSLDQETARVYSCSSLPAGGESDTRFTFGLRLLVRIGLDGCALASLVWLGPTQNSSRVRD
jgi:hypothetical protein